MPPVPPVHGERIVRALERAGMSHNYAPCCVLRRLQLVLFGDPLAG